MAKYVDLAKLPESPTSAITEIVALNDEGKIIKANADDFATKQDLEDNEQVVASAVNDLNERLESVENNIPTPQPTGTTATANSKQYIYCGDNTNNTNVVSDIINNSRGAGSYSLAVKSWGKYQSNGSKLLNFYMATSTTAGMMSADMYNKLMNLNTGDTATQVEWGANSNMNNYTTAGIYNITGERLNASDNLPINNSNPGHTIAARLYVLDSSISGNGDSQDKCITQILMLSNRTGGDGNIYTRTAQGSSYNNLVWEQWGKLQTNIEVGVITSYDNLTDNGIYSGVFTNGTTIFDTFVMLVINNYAVAGQAGANQSITQVLFVTHIDGTFEAVKRTNLYYSNGNMGFRRWTPLNGDIYAYNYPIAPDLTKVGKQTMRYTTTNYTIPSNTLNTLFYNHINELINNNWGLEIFTETVQFQHYNDGGGVSAKLYAEIYCTDRNNNFKKYQKIVVGYVVGNTMNQGVKVIQEIDFN